MSSWLVEEMKDTDPHLRPILASAFRPTPGNGRSRPDRVLYIELPDAETEPSVSWLPGCDGAEGSHHNHTRRYASIYGRGVAPRSVIGEGDLGPVTALATLQRQARHFPSRMDRRYRGTF